MNQMSIKKAALINAFSKYLTILLNLLFNAVLARLLLPEEFGIVAVITVFTTFFSVIADLGVGTGVIQNKGLTDKDINNIFSFTVYVALLIGVIFWCISKPLSIFYGNGIYISLGHLLAISVFFSTINMVPNALLMKEKRFISMALRTVVSNILSSVLAVIFAFKGFGAYSLVFQSLMNSVILFAWNYLNTRPAFRFKVEFVSILKIKSYSGYQFLFSFINYFSRNIDNLLIGRTMGESVLGYYDKAYKLMLYPTNNLTHVITPVLHPILSEYQNDKKYIYEKYMEVVRILSLLGILIMPVCFWCGEEIICIVFGEQWSASVYCFQILSLSAWAQMIASSSGSIFQSLGKTKNLFIQGCITSGVTCLLYTSPSPRD